MALSSKFPKSQSCMNIAGCNLKAIYRRVEEAFSRSIYKNGQPVLYGTQLFHLINF
jgi:hypothetical protein